MLILTAGSLLALFLAVGILLGPWAAEWFAGAGMVASFILGRAE